MVLLLLGAALLPHAHAQEPGDDEDNRFGVVLIPPEPAWLNRAYQAGARVNRYQLNWWDVEKAPGNRHFDDYDRIIAANAAAGLEVALLITAPPEWARRPGSRWVPDGLDRPWNDGANRFAAFVSATVSRYKGRVRYYEIFNEPDNDDFWDGTPQDYAATLAAAYQAAKAADPSAQIIMAGMAHWMHPQFAEEVLHALRERPDAAANNYFFDVAAWHWYSRADQLYERVLWARELLTRYGMDAKPIWINETNISVYGDGPGPPEPTWGFGSTAEQAAFMIQAYTNAFAAGAERVFVFRMHDAAMSETFGLMRNDGTPRPAYQAYKTAARWLAGARFATREVRGDVVVTVFRRPPDEKITVAWTNTQTGTHVLINAAAPQATLVTMLGEERTVSATAGAYNLGLGGGSVYRRPSDDQLEQLVGGPPVILVEQDRTPPLLTLDALPVLSASPQIRLSWEIDTLSGAPADHVEFQVREDDGPWVAWEPASSTGSSAVFDGEVGHHYAFRARAVGQRGQAVEWPPSDQPMAATTVGAALVGVVHDLQDRPLVGLTVCAAGLCAETDDAGFYRLSPLPGGTVTITMPRLEHIKVSAPTTLGEETSLATLRVAPNENAVVGGNMARLQGVWVVEPRGGATMADESGRRVARIRAGARLAQLVRVPAEGEPILSLRYRVASGSAGAPLQVGIYQPDGGFRFTRLLFDANTRGQWRELRFDMTPFAGQDIILELAATGSQGTADVDEVRLGPSTLTSSR